MNHIHQPQVASRRSFLKTSAVLTGAAAAQLVIPRAVRAAGSDAIRVGLVGCGGRGSGAAAQALSADKGVILTGLADAFRDQATRTLGSLKEQFKDRVPATPDQCFVGFDSYKQLIASDVDVVLLCSPPHFRPAHLKAAVEAGKHIFTEKPMAVDAPGVRSAMATVEEAKKKNLAIVAGFCWRYHDAHRPTFARVHDGAIGDVQTVYSYYNAGGLWVKPRKPEWSDMEWQIRNWLYFTWLSGDHLVEQAVHSVDKVAWAMKDVPPVRAMGWGGRQVRTDPAYGHIYDHFAVVYEWENGARAHVYCRQQDGTAGGVWDHITGTKGVCTLNSGQVHQVKPYGGPEWKFEGEARNMYQVEHDELFASIRAGKPINDGDRMMKSTMMAIMGRMATYTGLRITWEQAMNSKEDLTPPSYEWGPIATPPVAMPGKTKFL